jgi:hypothetical protein
VIGNAFFNARNKVLTLQLRNFGEPSTDMEIVLPETR